MVDHHEDILEEKSKEIFIRIEVKVVNISRSMEELMSSLEGNFRNYEEWANSNGELAHMKRETIKERKRKIQRNKGQYPAMHILNLYSK
jgi:hypothetical protein